MAQSLELKRLAAQVNYYKNREARLAQQKDYRSRPEVKAHRAEVNKAWRAVKKSSDPDWDKRRGKAKWQRLRWDAFHKYGTKCAICGEDRYELLTIDHVNGGGTQHRHNIGGNICQWLKNEGYPEGFRTLCVSCNYTLGMYGYTVHDPDYQEKRVRE